MSEPLFRIRPTADEGPSGVLVLNPYLEGDVWLFDDPATGLFREPFVGTVNGMIDRLAASITNPDRGIRLLFSDRPFPGCSASFEWVRADELEGHWYRAADTEEEGWLCPALFHYFTEAPETIYAKAEPRPIGVSAA